jgi:glycosyltransferase involved in cell wall biosynthesis
MKVLHISYSDLKGGAAIATNRIHHGFLNKNINSWLLVNEKIFDHCKTIRINNFFFIFFKKIFIKIFNKILKNKSGDFYSINYFSSGILKKINSINPSIVNLHWINNETISINEIAKIQQPLIWTMMDMWPFLGIEHYNLNKYFLTNKKKKSYLLNILNGLVLRRKKIFINCNFKVIAISNWLAKEAKKNFVFKKKKIYVIPLGLNFNKWKPANKERARNYFNFDKDKKYIVFSSSNGTNDFRKGFDFFLKALNLLKIKKNNLHLIVIGKFDHKDELKEQIDYTEYNKFFFLEPDKLIKLYSACDLLVAPSIQEAFGQVALEAASCNLPTVAFNNTGITDIILHKKTGYLAKFLSIKDFSRGIEWCLEDSNSIKISKNIRNYVKKKFSINVIVDQYKKIYLSILKNNE